MKRDVLKQMLKEGKATQETVDELSNGKGDDEDE